MHAEQESTDAIPYCMAIKDVKMVMCFLFINHDRSFYDCWRTVNDRLNALFLLNAPYD